ncbi:MAG: class I SAM-dependent methyltransferase [Methylothermaceae bacterium]|nr:class I SAM-dependent methyltransferase [Methylothermaceae bacterium]
MQSAYKEDLAYIHDAGFKALAENAVSEAIDSLRCAGIHNGLIVELGCGSGITSRILSNAGFDVMGIDLSEPLVEKARERVPEGRFKIGSFVHTEIPQCVAVTAIGEVLNYTFDSANNADLRDKLFRRIYQALNPGGLMIFDIAGPARAPSFGSRKTFVEAPDWAVLVEVEASEDQRHLIRNITTFRRQGDGYRRDREIHRLELINELELAEHLERTGFRVRRLSRYGSFSLPQGLFGFMARKPE